MPCKHALELPEILALVAGFLSPHALVASICVSKYWYQTLQHLVWQEITFTNRRKRLPNLQDLVKNETYVKSLQIYDGRSFGGRMTLKTWEAINQLDHIKEFSIFSSVDGDPFINVFWDLCQRVEILKSTRCSYGTDADLTSRTFSHLRVLELNIWKKSDPILDWLGLLKRCPNLETLTMPEFLKNSRLATEFLEEVAKGTWPALESIWKCHFHVSEDILVPALAAMRRVTGWTARMFGPRSFKILSHHFAILKRLDLAYCESSAMISILQEIMSSCPQLEMLRWGRIDGRELIRGRPWACTGLRELAMTIMFDREEIDQVQPLIFERLSQLKALEILDFSGVPTFSEWQQELKEAEAMYYGRPLHAWYTSGSFIPFRKTIDLRLGKGIEKLAALRSLQELRFVHTVQCLHEKEVDWMAEHWEQLNIVDGKPDSPDDFSRHVVKMFRARGIISLYKHFAEFSDIPNDEDE
ncbi:hypothetical protein BGZ99_008261 [Dissophora globulifera]|uniref:F-box domain-containing protein n=1 Tax=Dissophora globulifera TaxID=979702 RepID=A0A9P6RW53_9FUNG|nr:hypothetical protein BGZ99_008261 [Dissophora globulifera]